MTPAFGFSVGDFISAIGLVARVSKALKETGGASTEYQLVVIELKSLENILRHLESLQPSKDNATQVNAIRGIALACQLPLRDFMVKLEKYESTLGPFANKKSLRAMARKSKWAVLFTEDVERLRAMVAAKNISLNLLLAINTSQSLSRFGSRNEETRSDLMSKAAEHRAELHKVQDGIVQVEEKMSRAEAAFNQRFNNLEIDTSQARENSDRHFDEIGAKVEDTKTSVMSLRSTGEQILRCLGTFPREMRELLQSIIHANWQMYQVLLNIQQTTSRSPTGLLDSNIRFEDALGGYRELPYEYFRHWEPFEGFLRAQFKGKLGESKVLEGQYHIINVGNSRAVVQKEHWTRSIEQGAILNMSMIMSHLTRRADSCPRPSCPGGELKQCPISGLLSCKTCNLKFYPKSHELQDSSNRVEEEGEEEVEQIARLQNEEDLRLYGSRPEPRDALEIDSERELLSSLTKDNTAYSETAFDEAAKAHTTENISESEETKIHIDKYTEVNPLSVWLDKSALPSVAQVWGQPLDQRADTKVDPVQKEIEEIEQFRHVHLALDSVDDSHLTATTKAEDTLDLELPSQIYYRNIIDRYPLLPTYLARRLAEANSTRAERLSHQRVKAVAKDKDKYDLPLHGDNTKERAREPFVRFETQVRKTKASKQYQPGYPSLPGDLSVFKSAKVDKKQANSYANLLTNQPHYDYWNGGSPRQRTESVGSRSSSRNSSLHGSSEFCYQKQYQNVDYFAAHSQYHNSSPSLPPPPVRFGKKPKSKHRARKLSFDCDICGESVKVDKRRQWQKHVMGDLRPYVCTARECKQSTRTFSSLISYLDHEIEAHELSPLERSSPGAIIRRRQQSILCIFCGERTEAGRGDKARGRHVGRHMEEIAFTVVPKAYEKWEFYSESSSANSESYKATKETAPKTNATAGGANKQSASKASWHLREATSTLKHWDPREATFTDAIAHNIPSGYSLKRWDPEMRPILLLGSVFDAQSLGKWIYDWSIFCHGLNTPSCEIASRLWLLMIKLAYRMMRIEGRLSRSPGYDDEAVLEDFLSSAERLWGKLEKLLKDCEEMMLEADKRNGKKELGKESGREFVNTIFSPKGKLDATEALRANLRVWNTRFDAKCKSICPEAKARQLIKNLVAKRRKVGLSS